MSRAQVDSTLVSCLLSYAAEPIGQGKAKAKVFLEENPEIAAEIEAKLRQRLFNADDEALEDVVVDVSSASEDELLDAVTATTSSSDSEIEEAEDRVPVEEDK